MTDQRDTRTPYWSHDEGGPYSEAGPPSAPNTPWSAPPGAWRPAPPDPGLTQAQAEWLRGSLAQPPLPPRRGHPVLLAVLLAALLLAVAALLGLIVAHHLWQSHRLTTARLPTRSLAARVDPALVDLNVVLGDQSAEGAATGIVLSSSGLVLTNNHVVEGATQIKATDLGNGRIYSASVVGYDASQDVALIKLQGASGLIAARLGDSADVAVGQAVAGIDNAGGLGGAPTIARGTVVALGQQITASDALDGTSEQLSGLIQIDADIRPGDSGGPLVDGAGRVIALDTAASSGFSFGSTTQQHAGFAIPIDTAVSLVHKIENGQASAAVHIGPTAFLGVQFDGTNQGSFGAGGWFSSGATIDGVLPGTPAARAGLAAGDTIVSVGGQSVDSPDTLTKLLGAYRPGDRVVIGWVDQAGGQHASTVTLASGPAH